MKNVIARRTPYRSVVDGFFRRFSEMCAMPDLVQKQTSAHVRVMSALPPKADIGTQSWNVRFVPKADISQLHSIT